MGCCANDPSDSVNDVYSGAKYGQLCCPADRPVASLNYEYAGNKHYDCFKSTTRLYGCESFVSVSTAEACLNDYYSTISYSDIDKMGDWECYYGSPPCSIWSKTK